MINIICIIAAVLIIAADRLTKMWVAGNVAVGDTFGHIGKLFSLVYVQNQGAAFSMLSGRLGILSLISIGFCVAVIVYWVWKKPKSVFLRAALTLIAAGAAGNAFDRIFYGYVVDFVKTDFVTFPVFNIADMAITIGAVLIVVYECISDRKNGTKNKG